MSEDRKRKAEGEPYQGLPAEELIVIGGEGKTGPIPAELVVRSNGFVYSPDDIQRFGQKSRARCPTYGNCSVCFNSGPVGKVCTCRHGVYMVVMTFVNDSDGNGANMIDAEHFANLFQRNHEVAMVDRTFSWIKTPTVFVRRGHIIRLIIEGMKPKIDDLALEIGKTIFGSDYKP